MLKLLLGVVPLLFCFTAQAQSVRMSSIGLRSRRGKSAFTAPGPRSSTPAGRAFRGEISRHQGDACRRPRAITVDGLVEIALRQAK